MRVYLGRFFIFLSFIVMSMESNAQNCNDRIKESTPESRFKISGGEAIDLKTGLIWSRCPVGQTWNGTTCTGSVIRHTWSEAMTLTSSGWRLPNIKELASITETACADPALNISVFPTTDLAYYWSSSPSVSDSDRAWAVSLYTGNSGMWEKDGRIRLVRLVRDLL